MQAAVLGAACESERKVLPSRELLKWRLRWRRDWLNEGGDERCAGG
jgi:hypothetical protein